MECRDVRELADSFLGEELLTETNHEILRHLETCPVCSADLDARRALRDGVRRAFHRAADLEPSPEFIAELRTTLQGAAYQTPARRGLRLQGWWALAATVLLAVTVGLIVSRPRVDCGDRGAGARCRRRSSELRAAFSAGGKANHARRCRSSLWPRVSCPREHCRLMTS